MNSKGCVQLCGFTSGTRKAKTAAAITYVDECEAIHALTSFIISFIIVEKHNCKVTKKMGSIYRFNVILT